MTTILLNRSHSLLKPQADSYLSYTSHEMKRIKLLNSRNSTKCYSKFDGMRVSLCHYTKTQLPLLSTQYIQLLLMSTQLKITQSKQNSHLNVKPTHTTERQVKMFRTRLKTHNST